MTNHQAKAADSNSNKDRKVIPFPGCHLRLYHPEDIQDLARRLAAALYSYNHGLRMDYTLKRYIPPRVDAKFEEIARELTQWYFEDTDYDPFLTPVTEGSSQPPR